MSMETVPQKAGMRFSGPRVCAALLMLLCAAHGATNLWCNVRSKGVVHAEERAHVNKVREYHKVLFENPRAPLLQTVIAFAKIAPAAPVHPPLFHLLGALAMRVAGTRLIILHLLNLCFLAGLLVGFFLLCRELVGPWESLLAVTFMSLMPCVYENARLLTPCTLSALLSVWAVYALLKSGGLRYPGWVFAFACAAGLAMLSDAAALKQLLLPALAALVLGFPAARTRGEIPRLVLHAAIAFTVAVSVFSPWYFGHLEPFYQTPALEQAPVLDSPHLSSFSRTDMGLDARADAKPAEDKPPVVKPLVFWGCVALAGAGLVLSLLLRRFRTASLALFLAWGAGACLIPALFFKDETVAMGPVLSLFAAVSIAAIPWPKPRALAGGLVLLLLAAACVYLTLQLPGMLPAQSPAVSKTPAAPATSGFIAINLHSQAEVDQLSFLDLYRFQRIAGRETTRYPLKAYAEKRFQSVLADLHPKPQSVNDAITFVHAGITRVENNQYQVLLIFHVEKPLEREWRMYLHGQVPEDVLAHMPEEQRGNAYKRWEFAPDPPTRLWRANDYTVIAYRFETDVPRYNLEIGFSETDGHALGTSVSLGTIDFATLP